MIQSKHLKQSFNLETANRINELPDKLLCHILAFLPTRCAVATSILSKRWMYVWNDVLVLDFMDLPSSMTSSDINFNEIQYVRFKNFVNRVILLNGSPCLERVHFEAYKGFPSIYVYEWMLVIARRCVLELCVIAKHFSVKIPSNFLVDKEKLTVKLEGPFELDMLASFDLPCLEILSLSEVVFLNKDDPLSSILSSSKVLKELNIDRCKGHKGISVCSSSLKTLRIASYGVYKEAIILIETPNLKVLHLSIHRILQSVVNELSSLVEARLDIWTSSVRWIKLLQKICYTKTLVLHSIILDGSNYHNQLPVFQNLTHLEVGLTSWSIVLQILRHAPYLQCLIIHESMHDWPNINKVKRNGLSLAKIEYYGFDMEVGFEVVRYFLSNSALLNEFKIHTRPWLDAMAENEILKMLLTLPRASNQCEIIIVGKDNACMSEDSDSEFDWSEPDLSEPDEAEPDEAEPDEAEPDESEPDLSEPDESEPDEAEPDESEPDDETTDRSDT